MDLIKRYHAIISKGDLEPDKSQEQAINRLNIVKGEILDLRNFRATKRSLSGFFKVRGTPSLESRNKGLYMFGGVGTGKSMVMDLFFESVNSSRKRRVHFHAFMYEFHERLKNIRLMRKKDPVRIICQEILNKIDLLCFDEFQIIDITDAMIVGRLFQELFLGGLTVITTSNFHPEELYKDGLNRGLFLPFVTLLMKNVEILEVDNRKDYRNRKLRREDSYFCKEEVTAVAGFNRIWEDIVDNGTQELIIHYQGRELKLQNYGNGACRISFQELCEQPLSAVDYLNLCNHIKVLFLENIPILSSSQNDIARRFILLIDALYEANIRIVCLSAVEPESIYSSGRFQKEFARTVSRLNEMRGDDWPRKDGRSVLLTNIGSK